MRAVGQRSIMSASGSRRGRERRHTIVIAVALSISRSFDLGGNNASADIVYDLQYAPGSQDTSQSDPLHFHAAVAGNYTLDLWCQVSGTNGVYTDEALTNSYLSIVSHQVSGGTVSAGGITASALQAGFNSAIGRLGGAKNISFDGIGDW